MTLLAVESLDARHGFLRAVRDITLEVAEGETLAIVGANGAGKTTLLRAIAGAHKPSAGRISFEGAEITTLSPHRRVKLGIALVPEGRRLFTGMTVEENLLVARRMCEAFDERAPECADPPSLLPIGVPAEPQGGEPRNP